MKTAIAALLALTVAAPAFAGVKDVEAHFAQDNTGIESVVLLDSTPLSQEAADIFAALALETGTGIETKSLPQVGVVSVSSKGGVNTTAQAIFARLSAAEDASDK